MLLRQNLNQEEEQIELKLESENLSSQVREAFRNHHSLERIQKLAEKIDLKNFEDCGAGVLICLLRNIDSLKVDLFNKTEDAWKKEYKSKILELRIQVDFDLIEIFPGIKELDRSDLFNSANREGEGFGSTGIYFLLFLSDKEIEERINAHFKNADFKSIDPAKIQERQHAVKLYVSIYRSQVDAVYQNIKATIDFLLEVVGVDINAYSLGYYRENALAMTVFNIDIILTKYLFSKGAKVNALPPLEDKSNNRSSTWLTSIVRVAERQGIEIAKIFLKLILDRGVDFELIIGKNESKSFESCLKEKFTIYGHCSYVVDPLISYIQTYKKQQEAARAAFLSCDRLKFFEKNAIYDPELALMICDYAGTPAPKQGSSKKG